MRCKLRHYKTLVIVSFLLLATSTMIAEAEYQAHDQYSTTAEQTEDDIFELDIQPDIVEQPSYKVHHNTNSRQSNNIVNNQEEAPYSAQIKQYTREIHDSPTLPGGYSNRGHYYELSGKLDLALADYNNAIRCAHQAEDYISRGDLYLKLGKYAEATQDYHSAIFGYAYNKRKRMYNYEHKGYLSPVIVKLIHKSATIYCKLNDYQNAIEEYNWGLLNSSLVMTQNDISEIYLKKGELFLKLNKPQKALSYYKKALKKNPNNKLAMQAITKLGSLK